MSDYSNLPLAAQQEKNSTVQAFDIYYSQPISLDSTVLAAMTGYFTNRGFAKPAAESIAVILIKQAKKDGYNPMEVLNTLRGLSDVDLTSLVSEILNYNRFKTSSLGYAQAFEPNPLVARNILV
jgi:hypothetical protein